MILPKGDHPGDNQLNGEYPIQTHAAGGTESVLNDA